MTPSTVLPSAYATASARFHQLHSFGAPSRSRPSRQLRPFDLASFLSTLQRHRHRRRCKTRYELPGSGLARRDPPPLDDTPFPLRSANALLGGLRTPERVTSLSCPPVRKHWKMLMFALKRAPTVRNPQSMSCSTVRSTVMPSTTKICPLARRLSDPEP